MDEHANVARVREALDTFARGDLDGYREYFADDVVWHVGGQHPLSGDYRGRDALFEYFNKVRELTGGTLKVEPSEILADDSNTAVFARVSAQRDGRNLDVTMAQAFTFDADGKWSEYWAFSSDQPSVDAFWS